MKISIKKTKYSCMFSRSGQLGAQCEFAGQASIDDADGSEDAISMSVPEAARDSALLEGAGLRFRQSV